MILHLPLHLRVLISSRDEHDFIHVLEIATLASALANLEASHQSATRRHSLHQCRSSYATFRTSSCAVGQSKLGPVAGQLALDTHVRCCGQAHTESRTVVTTKISQQFWRLVQAA
jgi:hypothetical protein